MSWTTASSNTAVSSRPAFATLMLEHEHAPTEFLVDSSTFARARCRARASRPPQPPSRRARSRRAVAWAEAEGHVPTEVADLDAIIAGITRTLTS